MIPSIDARPPAKSDAAQRVTVRVSRVLIVDDALPIRRKLHEILHRAGLPALEVQTASECESALEIFARWHPTLVFTELPPGDGACAGFVQEMLTIDPQARIVLVTAEDPASARVRAAVRHGVFAIVDKPLRHDKIRAVLAEIEAEETGVERFR